MDSNATTGMKIPPLILYRDYIGIVYITTQISLGGGNSNIVLHVHPEFRGNKIQFDGRIFFKWVGSTTK